MPLREPAPEDLRWLRGLAARLVRDPHLAEDAVQSAYLNAFAAMAGFDGRASLSTWLTRIMINEALRRARAAAARNAALDEASVTVIDDYREKLMRGSASAVAPDADLARAQLRSVLERAIALLPDEFRLIFILREAEELSINEVAELLDIPAATVKTRHLRAKRRLQQALGPEVKTALLGTFPFGGATCAALDDDLKTGWGPDGARLDLQGFAYGRIEAGHPSYGEYRRLLRRTIDEPFALLLPV